MTTQADALTYLETELLAPQVFGLDRLRLTQPPSVPELRLLLTEDAILWWARMEADAGTKLTAPYWATAWSGGQAVGPLARIDEYVARIMPKGPVGDRKGLSG